MKYLFYWMIFQVLVGVWLIVSPYALGYREITSMTMDNLVFGAIVVILGIGAAFASFPMVKHAEKKTT